MGRAGLIWPGEIYSVDLAQPVELDPAGSGLDHTSYARCDQLRVVSVERLSSRQGMISPELMRAIDQALRFVLDL